MSARFAITSFLLLLSSSLFAQDVSLPSPEKLDAVANKQQWSHLLHYRTHPFSGRYISQNDSKNFFLAENGKSSLLDELQADLQAFLLTDQADNKSAQCQFPARYHWLKQQLPELAFIDQSCSELEEWQAEVDAEYVTLVFPA